MHTILVTVAKASYLLAALLFILGIKRMSSPVTARAGIKWAGVGMVIATLVCACAACCAGEAIGIAAAAGGFASCSGVAGAITNCGCFRLCSVALTASLAALAAAVAALAAAVAATAAALAASTAACAALEAACSELAGVFGSPCGSVAQAAVTTNIGHVYLNMRCLRLFNTFNP